MVSEFQPSLYTPNTPGLSSVLDQITSFQLQLWGDRNGQYLGGLPSAQLAAMDHPLYLYSGKLERPGNGCKPPYPVRLAAVLGPHLWPPPRRAVLNIFS